MKNKFSVIMSIYKSDVPEYVQIAFESMLNQTRLPDEIVVVADGPVPDSLKQVIDNLQFSRLAVARRSGKAERIIDNEKLPVEVAYLPQEKNRGLGEALRIAVENAKYDYLARMDADDICLPDRFEKQMKCFEEDPELSLVGGMITEFVDTPENIVDKRILPLEDKEIKRFMKSRCGVNHVTVIFKKEDLLKAGNYRSDYRQEDYYLWARMMKAGCKFKNIPDVVVNVRSGYDQFARRSGWNYYLDHCAIFRFMYREGLISFPRLVYNYVVRGIIQGLMPNWLRTWTYQHMLRK
jgi:glycosyltransferase involved in cell wall biosynthesis